ncbi:thioesterase [Streptomyces sp. G44]|uniref:thioesterase II family protein n=1 Tax=Streptomyces sp. G44 TaxID=2807632 RepID=UPI0019616AE7|nr:alpha/beta fold hydrolase [Streptomyces sp. G44]MBM7172993.1 thioesterase [Streptomyces sp. G44]
MDHPPPALRLCVLHHAGGSHLLYRDWPAQLPGTWDVQLLDAPGHGRLLDLPLITDIGRLADHLLRGIRPEVTGPYALFGHSMGAALAYEITRRIVARGLPLPVWVGISAQPAPQSAERPAKELAELPDAELRTRLKQLGGTPDEVLDDPGLWSVFAPVIRADLGMAEDWPTATGTGPLPVALSAYAGGADLSASPPLMRGWEEHTGHFLGLRVFDGGHFYFAEDPGPLLRRITRDVAAARAAADATRAGRS